MRISIIAAFARNYTIGQGNRIPWRIPDDLRRFKRLTMGHHLIIGRKTWESIGRPLPGRKMIIVSRDRHFPAPKGVEVADSLEKALELASTDDEVFIGGGEEIYRLSLPYADRMYLTLLDRDFAGDARFPTWDTSQWEHVSEEKPQCEHPECLSYRYVVLEKKPLGA